MAPVLADEAPVNLPDVVVTATRVPSPVEQIPAGVTIIDRKTIETHGYNTLSDALQDVPGVHVSQSGGPGAQTSVFIRGTEGQHVLVLRDGMPINDAADVNGGYTNFSTETLADVERIEVIRGPMASLYGSGAVGGVINIISRRGTQPGMHWEGDIAGGYPAAIRGSVSATGVEGPIDYAITAESQSFQGYDSTPQREFVYKGVAQGYRDRLLTMNLGYTPVDGTRLSLLLRGHVAYFGYNTLGQTDADFNPLPTFDDSNSNGKTSSLLGRLGLTTTLFDGALESGAFVGREQDDRRYQEPLNLNDPNLASSDSRYHSYRTDVQWNNTLHLDRYLQAPALSGSALTFGYEYTGDDINERFQSNSLTGFYGDSARASMVTNAIYAGLQTTVLKRLTLTGQIRQDWVDQQAPTTWRIGGVYDLKEISTHLKLAYGTAFRAPSLFERYGVDTFGFVGNPNLKPEHAEGWEAGFTTDVAAFGRPRFLTFGSTYFDQRITDLITSVFVPVDTEVNLNSAHSHGVETEATLRPFDWLDVHASWTFLNTYASGQSAAVGTRLLRQPQNSADVDVTVRPIPKLRIVTSFYYTGSAQDILIGGDGNGGGIGYGPGQHGLIANVAITYKLMPHVDLYLNGWNIFDSKFEPVNGYQTPGPTILAGARISL
ncbi:TonB-dependent receptor plug domain-containing protein [Rhodopila sp.]|uniref:TonB-dependent receptor plug domain-containing protein n=1 Tax=Rhodopila sp. TaxID=2480087 RepID=UPI002D810AE3|nr:TonB-dependent receptor [Rhodopila sp.]